MDSKKKTGNVFPIIASTFFGGTIGIFVDFFADKDILFTAVFAAVGLVVGIVKTYKKNK